MQEKKGAFTGICLRWLDKKTSSPNGGLMMFTVMVMIYHGRITKKSPTKQPIVNPVPYSFPYEVHPIFVSNPFQVTLKPRP